MLLGQVFMGYQGQPSTKLWVATFVRPCAGYRATVLNTMLYHNVENCVNLLREFEQYTAGPAGHGKGLGLGACNGRPSQCKSRDNISSLVTTIINDDLAENTGPNKVRIRSCCTLQTGRSDRYTP